MVRTGIVRVIRPPDCSRRADSFSARRFTLSTGLCACILSRSLILEGRGIAPDESRGRKVRTPQGAMPRNPVFEPGYTRAVTL